MAEQTASSSSETQHQERLDPSQYEDHQAAQHWARYEWACQFLPATRVLDCSCGLGYGSALLRRRGAGQVVGVDISAAALEQARERYGDEGIEYHLADALTLTPERLGKFDLIVSLETIEHVQDPQKLLNVFRALLADGGVLALSCPNDIHLGVKNPYHLWQAEFAVLLSWLKERFAHVNCYNQVHTFGASIWPAEEMGSRGDPFKKYTLRARLVDRLPVADAAGFLFACSDRPPPVVEPVSAELLNGDGYIKELERIRDQLWNEAQRLGQEVQRLGLAWKEQHVHIVELDETKQRIWDDSQKRIAELSEVLDQTTAEAQRIGLACQEQRAHIVELDETRRRIWDDSQKRIGELNEALDQMTQEAQRLGLACQEHHAHIAELDETKQRIWDDSQKRIAELSAALEQMTQEAQRIAHEWELQCRKAEQLENRLRAIETKKSSKSA